MMSSAYFRSTRTAARTAGKPVESGGRSQLADYIVDVVFIALLAAPFVIFQSPATVQDAVSSHATMTQAVVSSAAAAPAQTPAAADNPAYGPE